MKLAVLVLFAGVLSLFGWRALDTFRTGAAWAFLARQAEPDPPRFDLAMIADLPEPARRYFRFSIEAGTPLSRVVVIEMEGELGLGSRGDPKYRPMRASQILAPPHGLVWRLRAGPVSGSDGALPETSWTRFWLFHAIPVVRVSGDPDHLASAFGRVVAEAAFWTPAALLPSDRVRWEAAGRDRARATLSYAGRSETVEIEVDDRGAPVSVVIQRWSDANPEKEFRRQPFGGKLSEPRLFGGFRLPTRVEGGNHFGTDDYFPFYKVRVMEVDFL